MQLLRKRFDKPSPPETLFLLIVGPVLGVSGVLSHDYELVYTGPWSDVALGISCARATRTINCPGARFA